MIPVPGRSSLGETLDQGLLKGAIRENRFFSLGCLPLPSGGGRHPLLAIHCPGPGATPGLHQSLPWIRAGSLGLVILFLVGRFLGLGEAELLIEACQLWRAGIL